MTDPATSYTGGLLIDACGRLGWGDIARRAADVRVAFEASMACVGDSAANGRCRPARWWSLGNCAVGRVAALRAGDHGGLRRGQRVVVTAQETPIQGQGAGGAPSATAGRRSSGERVQHEFLLWRETIDAGTPQVIPATESADAATLCQAGRLARVVHALDQLEDGEPDRLLVIGLSVDVSIALVLACNYGLTVDLYSLDTECVTSGIGSSSTTGTLAIQEYVASGSRDIRHSPSAAVLISCDRRALSCAAEAIAPGGSIVLAAIPHEEPVVLESYYERVIAKELCIQASSAPEPAAWSRSVSLLCDAPPVAPPRGEDVVPLGGGAAARLAELGLPNSAHGPWYCYLAGPDGMPRGRRSREVKEARYDHR